MSLTVKLAKVEGAELNLSVLAQRAAVVAHEIDQLVIALLVVGDRGRLGLAHDERRRNE